MPKNKKVAMAPRPPIKKGKPPKKKDKPETVMAKKGSKSSRHKG